MKLTTITAYWNRPQMLEVWLEAIRHVTIPGVEHILFHVTDDLLLIHNPPPRLLTVVGQFERPFSIGHVHNNGAQRAETEWIMKLDIDTLPSLNFFRELMPLLDAAPSRAWFNCGMVYFRREQTQNLLRKDQMPLTPDCVAKVTSDLRSYSTGSYCLPSATNFICRRQDYLELGGCDPRFDGYGWEDYQQIYMLERHQQGRDPLPGPVTLSNVTRRCRDEISRRKAKEMFDMSHTFCLFHRWHAPAEKNRLMVDANRKVLFDWIECHRVEPCESSSASYPLPSLSSQSVAKPPIP